MRYLVSVLTACLLLSGCDEPNKKPEKKAKPTAEATANKPEKPKGPPQFIIDAEGPKVGWTRVLIEKKDGKDRLAKELDGHKQHIDGKDLTLVIDRKAKLPWVMAMLNALEDRGAASFLIKTGSRKEFPAELKFLPQNKIASPKPCTLVATVLADRGTAVWKLSGGTASKRTKGFAGPDLSTTRETMVRRARACKDSTTLFISSDESVEWGLAYDLAAAAQRLEPCKTDRDCGARKCVKDFCEGSPKLDTLGVLREIPVAGRPVKLK